MAQIHIFVQDAQPRWRTNKETARNYVLGIVIIPKRQIVLICKFHTKKSLRICSTKSTHPIGDKCCAKYKIMYMCVCENWLRRWRKWSFGHYFSRSIV